MCSGQSVDLPMPEGTCAGNSTWHEAAVVAVYRHSPSVREPTEQEKMAFAPFIVLCWCFDGRRGGG